MFQSFCLLCYQSISAGLENTCSLSFVLFILLVGILVLTSGFVVAVIIVFPLSCFLKLTVWNKYWLYMFVLIKRCDKRWAVNVLGPPTFFAEAGVELGHNIQPELILIYRRTDIRKNWSFDSFLPFIGFKLAERNS